MDGWMDVDGWNVGWKVVLNGCWLAGLDECKDG